MKNLPLAVQIWVLCAAITLSVSLLIMVFLPGMLQQFFTNQVLSILEDSQKNIQVGTVTISSSKISNGPTNLLITTENKSSALESVPLLTENSAEISIKNNSATDPSPLQAITITLPAHPASPASVPFMNHIYFSEATPLPSGLFPEPFYKKVTKDAARQTDSVQKYTEAFDNKTLLYVIRKTKDNGCNGNLISYSWGSYRNDMAGSLYRKLMLLMLVIIVLSWIPSLLVSRHLTRPLVKMENQVLKIGSKEWDEPLELERGDEIGRLAKAFENMRQRLLRQDQAQQTYLQNISHSLKTPIMVIQSYSKAILDGIYPKGDLESSLLTIQNEADRTNKLVQDLLMLNKITYLSTRDLKIEPVPLAALAKEIADKLRSRRPELKWEVQLADYSFAGDPDQWKIVLENLLDNATRYAVNTIQISLQPPNSSQGWWLRIWNEGMPIDDDYLEKIFDEYYAGQGGQSGLGLAIVRHIVQLHKGKVWAANENNGVAFYIG
ncbi:MAG: HAMP domain-containing sensor histidine kinase [Syntrophomonadaceae bacterium]|nr:HAMP domain-containing sensor histidine kinase [Syntrophomonadaceae bacterium]